MKFKFIAKENISHLPKSPGVYVFRKGGQILYIGKAANLRERVRNHLQQTHSVWEQTLLRPASAKATAGKQGFGGQVGCIKTDSEIEALILEAKLIKKYQPKYNVMWRDDKNYFYVGITKEPFPRIFITHQPKAMAEKIKIQKSKIKITNQNSKLKTTFIGPFIDGKVLKQALNVLRRVFPYRTCKSYSGRPCLWYQLARCPGPCLLGSKLAKEIPGLKKAIKKESQRNAKNLKKILEGEKTEMLKNLKREMKDSSKIRDFERAANIRDQIWALERILSHSKVFDWPESATSRKRRSPDSRVWRETEKILRKILKIKGRVKRIEAYDVSNIQGQNATGSMVTFINGTPDKNFYRRFKIKIGGKPNDVAMLKEVLTRRFQHSEWGRPDLILIDGGKAQLNAAISSIKYQVLGIKIPVIALAKKRSVAKPRTKLRFGAGENKLFIEKKKGPVLLKTLPREIFNLILQLRDEAHRFAIAYHKKLRDVDLRENF